MVSLTHVVQDLENLELALQQTILKNEIKQITGSQTVVQYTEMCNAHSKGIFLLQQCLNTLKATTPLEPLKQRDWTK